MRCIINETENWIKTQGYQVVQIQITAYSFPIWLGYYSIPWPEIISVSVVTPPPQ